MLPGRDFTAQFPPVNRNPKAFSNLKMCMLMGPSTFEGKLRKQM